MSLITRAALLVSRGKSYVRVVDLFATGLNHNIQRVSARRSADDIEVIRKEAAESVSLFARNGKGAFLSLREQLTDSVLGMAKFCSLVLNPESEADPTGLRGQIGISGGLRDRLLELYTIENYMPEYKFETYLSL